MNTINSKDQGFYFYTRKGWSDGLLPYPKDWLNDDWEWDYWYNLWNLENRKFIRIIGSYDYGFTSDTEFNVWECNHKNIDKENKCPSDFFGELILPLGRVIYICFEDEISVLNFLKEYKETWLFIENYHGK